MSTRDNLLSWRTLLASAAAAALAPCEAPASSPAEQSSAAPGPEPSRAEAQAASPASPAAAPAPSADSPSVTVLGDSITAGYELSANQALPVQLEAALRDVGVTARERGAGVSGDTTGGGLARVDFSVQDDTDVVLVALGGNDLLQGIDPARTRSNLDAIIRRLKARGFTVVLAGMQAPPQLGTFARDFNALYPDLSRKHEVRLYPFLLQGVALERRYNQDDGIHPNAEGARLVARGLAPVVAEAVKADQAAG